MVGVLDKGMIGLGKCFIIGERLGVVGVELVEVGVLVLVGGGEVVYLMDEGFELEGGREDVGRGVVVYVGDFVER